ncbi:glycosyl transferase group 1 [Segniliparus rotundus DSM 44985]|uniref:Glycosyl transferase group 1 n=1 Tax=Segniliparus rotundus (strain ATCC BAA-972 / CDC 1076 / CIP 108378 / DSM 44985 / JCM 13578) TaxID=640132 RepID=D6Z8I4_SEGRD|nr:glycosyltransferase family 4 protein [Segniliparus rotundus]ADG98264.1 glycosyl transferase group 1 [Segniliparus rotundus DSM 44985]
MRVGIVCPYSLDVPGGVQAHVLELAQVLIDQGHEVQVIAPASDGAQLPAYVFSSGRTVAVPYNGSKVRLQFGPGALAKLRRWIAEGDFDVLHVHEPSAPSLSFLAVHAAEGPLVATFHAAAEQSFILSTMRPVITPYYEKIVGRIAVSPLSRRLQMEAVGAGSVEIPNGLHVREFRGAEPLAGYPRQGGTVLFLGRYDEPRKGFVTLLRALPELVAKHPDVQVLVVGPGDKRRAKAKAGAHADRLRFLGRVDKDEKASALRSADVFCAPNTGGESQGIVLLEAMAAGAAVAASDLEAFRRVLDGGRAGVLLPVGDAAAWAQGVSALLSDPSTRERYVATGFEVVAAYDWGVIAKQILRVYETVTVGAPKVRVARA